MPDPSYNVPTPDDRTVINCLYCGKPIEIGRKANPALKVIARSHSDEEEDYLRRMGVDAVILGEREIALGMLDWLRQADSDNTTAGPTAPAPA